MAKHTVTVKVDQEGDRYATGVSVASVPLDRAFLKAEEMVRDLCVEPDDGYNPYEIKLELVRTSMKSTSFGDHREWTFEFEAECSD